MTESFKFSDATRRQLHDALARRRRVSKEQIEQFVEFAAHSIERWSQKWPPVSAEDMAESRRRLDNIQTHLFPLFYEFRNLHAAIAHDLRSRVVEITENGGRGVSLAEARRYADEMAERFEVLRQAVTSMDMDYHSYNKDRDTLRKRVLIGALAKDFETCFNLAPTTTPDGSFMEALGIVSEVVGTRLGKDVAAGVLREIKSGTFWDAL